MARSRRRAISDIVAVVMLIIIAIAAAVLIYAWMSGLIGGVHSSNSGLYTKIEIVGASITGSSPNYTLSTTVDNIGGISATINYLAVEFATNSSVICSHPGTTSTELSLTSSSSWPVTIPPGSTQLFSGTCSLNSGVPAPGTPVVVVVSTDNGVTATYQTTWP
ncbi:MAG: hypothetical protein RXO54_06915 [Acidilobus sp.]